MKIKLHVTKMVNCKAEYEKVEEDNTIINVPFSLIETMCKYQDIILRREGITNYLIKYCDYNTPSTKCNREECPVLQI